MKIFLKPLTSAIPDAVQFELDGDKIRITVGRKPDNDFVIPLPNVSSYHAVLEREGDGIHMEDLNSTNGVFINGIKIETRTPINSGDRISFGSVDFLFEIEQMKPVPAMPAGDGTMMVDSSEFLGEQPVIAPADDSMGPVEKPGSSTVLFGMKDVLMAPRLVMLNEQRDPTEEYALDRNEITIGRDPENNIQIDHASISRLHARIIKKGENTFQITDENSTNGLFLDDKQVNRATLHHGEVIRCGDVEAVFLAPGKLFAFEELKAGKTNGSSGGLDRKKLIMIVCGVLVVVLIILMLIPTGDDGGGNAGGKRLTADEIMKEVQFSMDNQDWDRVVQLVDTFQLNNADQQLAKAKHEIESRTLYQQMNQKINDADFAGADEILKQIATDTVYAARGKQTFDDAVTDYITDQDQQIEEAQGESRYTDALQIAEDLKQRFPNRKDVLDTYTEVKSNADRFSRQQARNAAYARRQQQVVRAANSKINDARDQYVNGKIVDALASLTEAGNAYIAKGFKVPSRIKLLKDRLNELRQNYTEGKQLILQGKLQQAAPKLQRVFQISDSGLFDARGAIEAECTNLLVDYNMDKANALYKQQNYAAAYGYLQQVLQAKPGMSAAQTMKREIEGKGQELYNKGYIEQTQYQNCKQALFYFRQVIQMVPKDNELYKKAQKRIADCE